jgi:hypothetical protein
MRVAMLAAVFLAGLTQGAMAAPTCNDPQWLHLAGLGRGNSSAVVEKVSNVTTDRTACYRLRIPAGRKLEVSLFSDNSNGFIQLYAPDWTASRKGDGWVFTGPSLPGAGPADHATKWKGPAPIGNILIVIDMPATGHQYRLRVEAL